MLDVGDELGGLTGQVVRADVEVAPSGTVQAWLLLAVTGVGQCGALTAQTGGPAGDVEDQINSCHSSSPPPLLPALGRLLVTQEAGTQVSPRDLNLATGRPGGTTSLSRAASASPDPRALTLSVWGRISRVRSVYMSC